MSLREQFEAWLKANYPGIVDRWVDDPEGETEAMWGAFQAGHAVNADLLEACEDIVNEMAIINDNGKRVTAKIEWSYLIAARDAIKKAKGEA